MVRSISNCFLSIPLLAATLGTLPANAQQPSPAPSSTPSTGAGNAPSPGNVGTGNTRGTYGNIPNNNRFPTNPQSTQQMERPYFFSGRVMFDDGTQPNTDIRIERVCGTTPRLEAHTDSKGRFYFQLGQNMTVDADASMGGLPASALGRNSSAGGFDNGDFGAPRGSFGSQSSNGLWNCELRASFPGFHSDTVRLAGRMPMDNPDVGTIVLHRIGHVEGTTVSLTTALAPKAAQKAYKKGLQLAEKGKLDEAQQRLREATDLYPKYAVAWYALGQAQEKEGQKDEARKSYQSAIDADSRYVNPYDQMARLAAQQGNWSDAAKFSKQAISLNAVEFPSSLWYNAVASYQLKNEVDAEKSVRDLLKLDTRHNFPQAESMMGELLLRKGDYAEAATHLKSYLTLMPKADNANAIKNILTKIDTNNALTKTTTPAPQQQ